MQTTTQRQMKKNNNRTEGLGVHDCNFSFVVCTKNAQLNSTYKKEEMRLLRTIIVLLWFFSKRQKSNLEKLWESEEWGEDRTEEREREKREQQKCIPPQDSSFIIQFLYWEFVLPRNASEYSPSSAATVVEISWRSKGASRREWFSST